MSGIVRNLSRSGLRDFLLLPQLIKQRRVVLGDIRWPMVLAKMFVDFPDVLFEDLRSVGVWVLSQQVL